MLLKNKFIKNVSWIFIGNVVHAVLSFLLGIYVARELSKADYGIINYAASWIAFFTAGAGLGFNSVINKFFSEDVQESGKYISVTIVSRAIISVVSVLCIAVIIFLSNGTNDEIVIITVIQSFSIVFSAGDSIIYWFRYRQEANLEVVYKMIAFFLSATIKILAIAVFKNLYLYTFGIACETLFLNVLLVSTYKKKCNWKIGFDFHKFRNIIKSSYPFIFSNILVVIYGQTDKIMLQNMLDSESVATYSVALTIAGIVQVIATAAIEGFRPEIISYAKAGDMKNYNRRLRQTYCIVFWLCVVYGIFITLFSKPILLILYGEKYVTASNALSLVVWYTAFSYFGSIHSIFMVAEGKEKWVQVKALAGAICNVLLNILLIPFIGIEGAALASLLTQVMTNVVMMVIIRPLRPAFFQMIKGISFCDIREKSRSYVQ